MDGTGYTILWLVLASVMLLLLLRNRKPAAWWWYSGLYFLLSFFLLFITRRWSIALAQERRYLGDSDILSSSSAIDI
jgi:hypothetical protein